MGAAAAVPQAIALAFAEAGADVAVTSATSDAEEAFGLRRLVKRITDLGRRSMAESVDMSLGTNVQIAVRQISKELGAIDILVAAPDLRLSKPSERLTDADWSRVLNANLSAVFYACRSVAREMLNRQLPPDRETDRGRIIVLQPAITPTDAPQSAYIAARAAIEALIRALAAEWSPRGIAVNVIALPTTLDDASYAEAAAALALRLASKDGQLTTGEVVKLP